jgi:hypothetical protein
MVAAQARTAGARPGSRAIRLTLAALAGVFLIVHLPWLVTAPGDIDEVNFVMGVREFNVAAHQPHPPGYAVFIALGKLAYPLSARWDGPPANHGGPAAAESRALAIWAALLGALGLVPLFVLLRSLDDARTWRWPRPRSPQPPLACAAARPLSTCPAGGALANALLVAAWHRQHASACVNAATPWCLAPDAGVGLAAGLAAASARRPSGSSRRSCVRGGDVARTPRAPAAPVRSSGRWPSRRGLCRCWLRWGLGAYLDVFREQFSEDAALVEMLWTQPTRQNVVSWFSVKFSSVGPRPLAVACSASAIGVATLGRRIHTVRCWPRCSPYLVFDALFQEVVTVRMPCRNVPHRISGGARPRADHVLVPLPWVRRRPCLAIGSIALVDQSRDCRRCPGRSPTCRAGRVRQPARLLHQPYRPMLRHEPFTEQLLPLTPMWWLDLEMWFDWGSSRSGSWPICGARSRRIDSRSRHLVGTYGPCIAGGSRARCWAGCARARAVVGARSAGLMLGEGWALTPEASGVTRAGHRFPQDGPVVAYARRRPGAATLMIGGRHLDPDGSRPAELTAAIDGRPVASWVVAREPGWFLQWIDLEPGALAGSGEFAT